MICKIKGTVTEKSENRVVVEVNGISYEVHIPRTVSEGIGSKVGQTQELIIYDYFAIDGNRGTSFMVGFIDELERDFFEKFISVSGVGPKAALRAFDKPISSIAVAIEQGDVAFLISLVGIGKQRAKQIVASLQGKVGRFALIKEADEATPSARPEIVEQAQEILKRLQYNNREAQSMIQKALGAKPGVDTVEELLNEIYRQRV